MAVHALKPATSPANTDRMQFSLALTRFANARTAQAVLPASVSIERQLAATPATDLPSFNAKLRLILVDLGAPALVMECLVLDVRRLARGEGGA